jgi:hypothetical protein
VRTYEEIAEKCRDTESSFGFHLEVLVPYLPYKYAKDFLKEDVVEEEWDKKVIPLTEDNVKRDMGDYMEFAWGKVIDHRGLSASRSVEKMAEWCWLLGDDESVEFAETDGNYAMYGAPILNFMCQKHGFPVPEDNDDLEKMIAGQPCHKDCHGCNG